MPAGWTVHSYAELSECLEAAVIHFNAAGNIAVRRWTSKRERTDFHRIGVSYLVKPAPASMPRQQAQFSVLDVEDVSHDRSS
jgi:hypothetical protein